MKTRTMAKAAVFAAVICIMTGFVHIPSHTGYTHVGDGIIFLCACLMPKWWAVGAAAVGGGLADVLSGYAFWAPGTVIIKAATALLFSAKKERIICRRNLFVLPAAWAICIGGYYLYEAAMTGNFVAPAAGIPGYVTQCVLSTILYIILGAVFDRNPALKK